MNNNEFSALLVVIFVVLACMGLVSIVGAIFVPTNKVACEVQVPSSDKVIHSYVGTGVIL